MFLREIVINGFKSFADRTRLGLSPGVVAIVGPNGCGKSNIVDAVRWVLGEQSAKALRGGKMQDVIFAGTDQRKPLPLCEVSLTFSDCEKELGTSYHEVEISRRVSRDGQGEYFLNGKACRLKDIQNLFMDTGVGRVSYSFMVQGQIDQILSANPADRRVIFEEAAGITRYKSQRKETMNKLSLVDQNLARVTDVIEEVNRQIGSLKRQAGKALRYKRLKHRFTHLDLALQSRNFSARHTAIEELEKTIDALKGEVGEIQGGLREREEALLAEKAHRAELAERLQETQAIAANLRSEKEQAESAAQTSQVRAADHKARIGTVEAEIASLETLLAEIASRKDADSQQKQSALDTVGASDGVFQEHNRVFESIQQQIAQGERDVQSARQDLLMLESGITRIRSNSTNLEVELKTFEVKHAAFGDAVAQLRSEREAHERRLEEITTAAGMRREEMAAANAQVEEVLAQSTKLRADFRACQQQIQELDREVARGAAHVQALEALQSKLEGFSEGAKAVLKGDLGEILPAHSCTVLSRFVDVDEAWMGAFETLLGPAVDAIAVDNSAQAAAAVNALQERRLGRACFQIKSPARVGKAAALPEFLKAARSVVSLKREDLAPLVDNLLAGAFVADSLENFLGWWDTHPEFEFEGVATARGEWVDKRGLIFGGRDKNAADKPASFMAREAEIRKKRVALHEKNDALTALNENAMRLQAEMDAAEKTVEQRRARVSEIGQELTTLQAEERAVNQTLSQNAEQTARQQSQLEALEASRVEMLARLEKGRAQLAEAEAKIEGQKALIAAKESEVQQVRARRDASQESLNQIRVELAEKRQKLQLLDRGLSDLQRQESDARSRLETRRREIDTLTEQIAAFHAQANESLARAGELAKTLDASNATLAQDRARLQEVETQIREREQSMGADREAQSAKGARLNESEVKIAEERAQARFIEEKVFADHQLDVRTVDWKLSLWKADENFEKRVNFDELDEDAELEAKPKKARGEPTDDDLAAMDATDWEPLAREIGDLRERIANMGAVNTLAIEEYAELKQRYDFLKTQSDDLWNAKNELVKAIDDINKTSQELFQQTFEQIRQNFHFTFNKLFGGGEADLQLVQSEDLLDSGVDIVARPPGTKLRSLSLLSGGQKTMTALSLLFAIYMVKPSPFCVLDELDAPLDDANVGRYTEIVKDFTKYSQFLIITHNKRTIAAANRIYGVTMQERGVTRLVSMRFDEKRGDTVSAESDVESGR